MLTVIAVILILAAILLNVAGYVQNKAARARAEAEIKGMSAALENYKSDNGVYPGDIITSGSLTTGALNANPLNGTAHYDPTQDVYKKASRVLRRALTGDNDDDSTNAFSASADKSYMDVKPSMQATNGANATNTYMQDPFGNSYGYSTAYAVTSGTKGYNPTFDLWSTGGGKTSGDVPKWIKNW
jgi:type II secretory pathway pseudopilin PulG